LLEPRFDLHKLGWKAFQDLCATILSQVLGQTFEVFSASRDGGRDGAFLTRVAQGEFKDCPIPIATQSKHTSRPDLALSLDQLGPDLSSARRLSRLQRAKTYVLLTNHKLTGVREEEISRAFQETGTRQVLVLGYEKLCQWIKESSRLRQLVPRLYGLGDLSSILDERIIAQTEQLLSLVQDDLKKFVPTHSFRKAVEALNKHNFVLLTGEPAVGKSAIAATLCLSAPDAWDATPIRVEDAEEFHRHWNPHDSRRVFWVDDAFGPTHFIAPLAHAWSTRLPALVTATRSGSKVILTSRDYIYRQARPYLKAYAYPLLSEAEVVVEVEDLTTAEKQQILYNHLKFGDQERSFLRSQKAFLRRIAEMREFRPELARRLGNRAFTRGLEPQEAAIRDFFSRPEAFLTDVLLSLEKSHFAGLALLYQRGGSLEMAAEFSPEEKETLARLESSIGEALAALSAMCGTFVRIEHADQEAIWTFKHPTIRDALGSVIAQRPELLSIYLGGTQIVRLLREIACGDSESKGVRVVLGAKHFEPLAARIAAEIFDEGAPTWSERTALLDLIAHRSSPTFIQKLVDRVPGLPLWISSKSGFLSLSIDFEAVARLRAAERFPTEASEALVDAVVGRAVEMLDLDFIRFAPAGGLVEAELREIRDRLEFELLPNLTNLVEKKEEEWGHDEEPDAYFQSTADGFVALRDRLFKSDLEAVGAIDAAFEEIELATERLQEQWDEESRQTGEHYGDGEQAATPRASSADIFDDLDD
jgi:hypothetical protein